MKKLLGISLVAVLAATPLMAMAGEPVAPTSSFTNETSGLEVGGTNVVKATKGAYYAGKTITDNDKAATASAAYVKGAYNDAISAINKVHEDAQSAATSAASAATTAAVQALDASLSQTAATSGEGANGGLNLSITETDGVITAISGSIAANTYDAYGAAADAVAALDKTESQTAGADGLALSITQTDGVITSISGSIAANTYDAYGSAATAEQNAKNYAAGLASNYDAYGSAATAEQNAKAYTDNLVYTTTLAAGSTVTGNVPMMVDWGTSSSTPLSLVNGTVATSSITTTAAQAPAQEPAPAPAQG